MKKILPISSIFICFLLLAGTWPSVAHAQNSMLDASFGNNGSLNLNTYSKEVADIEVQPDRRILVLTRYKYFSNHNYVVGYKLIRLLADGKGLDASFGDNGIVTSIQEQEHVQHEGDIIRTWIPDHLTLMPDLKILVTGTYYYQDNGGELEVFIRLLPDGNADSAFGSYGRANGYYNGGEGDRASDIGQPKFLKDYSIAFNLEYYFYYGGEQGYDYSMGRILPDGTSDKNFIPDNIKYAAIGIQDGEDIISLSDKGVGKHNKGGDLNNQFGNNGYFLSKTIGGFTDKFRSIAIGRDGKILLLNFPQNVTGESKVELVKLKRTGDLDSTFGNGGRVSFPGISGPPTDDEYHWWYVMLERDRSIDINYDNEKIIITSEIVKNGKGHKIMARFNTNGSIDPTFGQNGVIQLGGYQDGRVRLQCDNKILYMDITNGILYRYLNDITGCSRPFTAAVYLANPPYRTCDGSNAKITVYATGGETPYQGTGTYDVQPGGTYTYTVKDAQGIESQTSITIDSFPVFPPLTVTSQFTPIKCAGEQASIYITAAGGWAPYTNTGTYQVYPGTYTYTVTDVCNVSVTTEPIVIKDSKNIRPEPVPYILGQVFDLCDEQGVAYSCGSSENTQTYLWGISSRIGKIVSGQNTQNILIDFNEQEHDSQSITVIARNTGGCNSSVKLLYITSHPIAPVINGPDCVPAGQQNVVFTAVNDNPGYIYNWTVDTSNVKIISGQGTPTIVTNWGSGTGFRYINLDVIKSDGCKKSDAKVTKTINPTQNCTGLNVSSAASAPLSKDYVFPNPAKDYVITVFYSDKKQAYDLSLSDVNGRILSTRKVMAVNGENRTTISTAGLSMGTYFVLIKAGGKINSIPVVIE